MELSNRKIGSVHQTEGLGVPMASTRKMQVWPAITVSPEITVLNAVKAIVDKNDDAVLIIEGGNLLGIFTERDLIERVSLKDKRLSKVKMRDVMTPKVHTVLETISTEEAIRTMYMRPMSSA